MRNNNHYVRRNALALEILRAIDNYAKSEPELTDSEIQITLLEVVFQRASRRERHAAALDQVLDAAINLAHQHDSRQASSGLDDAVDALCCCGTPGTGNFDGPDPDCYVHGRR